MKRYASFILLTFSLLANTNTQNIQNDALLNPPLKDLTSTAKLEKWVSEYSKAFKASKEETLTYLKGMLIAIRLKYLQELSLAKDIWKILEEQGLGNEKKDTANFFLAMLYNETDELISGATTNTEQA